MMVLGDLKYAIRLLLKKPGFSVLTTLVMATGIGLSIFLFSFFRTIVFSPMPFTDGDTLLQISASQDGLRNANQINLSDYDEIRQSVQGIAEFGAYRTLNYNVSGRDGARRYTGVDAEANIFQITRTQPILGRGFSDAEAREGAEHVVVISYDIWQNQFGGNQNAIDQSIRINGVSHRIIGVMPEKYVFPYASELWRPLKEKSQGKLRSETGDVHGIIHIADGYSVEAINKEIDLVMQRIAQKYPETNTGVSAYASAIPLSDEGGSLPFIYSVHVIAILVLILASVNVGNLLLARAIERSKETAIRVALGAPKFRLISQMVWESFIICVIGGLIGLIILAWGLELTANITKSFFVDTPPFWWIFEINAYNLQLLFLFVIGAVVVTGFLPAWKNASGDFNQALRSGTRGALSKKDGRLNRFLIITEIFVSLTVLIASCVMMAGNYKSARADYGARVDGILTAEVQLNSSKYETPEQKTTFIKTLTSRLESESRIGDVMVASTLPGNYAAESSFAIDGMEYNEEVKFPRSNYVVVGIDTLTKLDVELKEGRHFNSADEGLDKRSVIVTESFATQHFDGKSPLGKRIRVIDFDGEQQQWLTVVGVVQHTIHGASYEDQGKLSTIFRPVEQAPLEQLTIAVEMKAGKNEAIESIRETLASIDPDLPAFRIEAYKDSFSRHTDPMLFMTTLMLMFGLAAIVLAVTGIYGVMTNTVNRRTQEIGIKRALGADERRIIKEFMKGGVRLLLWGGIPGLLAGAGLGFAMSQALGVGAGGLLMITVVLLAVIAATVLIATYIPTQRVLKMEPSQALRYE